MSNAALDVVDLRSDTVTRPTAGMRQAMVSAELGDDVFGDDPTVNRLQDMAAERLNKSFAMFVPSGTMANQIAIALHTRPGDAVVVESGAHPFNYEAGAAAVISGASLIPVSGERGLLSLSSVRGCFHNPDPHIAPVQLVCAEDTANRGGGTVYPLELLDGVARVGREGGAAMHLDGARLFNAAVASGVDVDRRTQAYDTVSICLSKGLGAPVGSLLFGPLEMKERAWRMRKALGGGMRQVGILAAAGLYALEHHVDRLADDHRRCRELGRGLKALGCSVNDPETNMVYVQVPDASSVVDRMKQEGVWAIALSATDIRMVVHLDVDDAGIARAVEAVAKALRG